MSTPGTGEPTSLAGRAPSAPCLVDERDASRATVSHERVWNGAVFGMDEDQVVLAPGATPVVRQYLAHHGAVAVVGLREGPDSSQPCGGPEVLLIRQYRHPVGARLWEVPAGLLDVADEDPLAAAQRELFEETDYRAGRWEVLADFFSSPGCSTEGLRLFLARDLTHVPVGEGFVREDEEAEMVPTWVALEDAVEAILDGRIHNPSAVAGLLATDAARRRGWETLRPADAPWLRAPTGFDQGRVVGREAAR